VPERVTAGQRLPEHHADRPDVRRTRRGVAREPLRRDVRQGSGHVPLRGQRFRFVHLRQPEVEDADGHPLPLGEQHVRGLDVAVDDPAAVGVRKRLEHLRDRFDRRRVVELAAA
jgi:hypothetical protein